MLEIQSLINYKPCPQRTHSAFSPKLLQVQYGRCEGDRTRRMRYVGKWALKAQGGTVTSHCPSVPAYKADDEKGKDRQSNHSSFDNSKMGFPPLFQAFLSACSYLRGLGALPPLPPSNQDGVDQVLHLPKAQSLAVYWW